MFWHDEYGFGDFSRVFAFIRFHRKQCIVLISMDSEPLPESLLLLSFSMFLHDEYGVGDFSRIFVSIEDLS